MDKPNVDNIIRFGEGSATAKRGGFQQELVRQELTKAGFQGTVTKGESSLEKLARRAAAERIRLGKVNKKLTDTQEIVEIDELTGVLNRKGLNRRMEEAIAHHNRKDTRFEVLFMDIDGFKAFNKNYGHPLGDEVLREFAQFMNIRGDDVFARYGGDEFVLLLDSPTPDAAEAILKRMDKFFKLHAKNDPRWTNLGVSAGLRTLEPEERSDAESLLRDADAAMYEAKETPGTTLIRWKPGMNVLLDSSFYREQ